MTESRRPVLVDAGGGAGPVEVTTVDLVAAEWRELLDDYEGAVELTERWAALETAVRLLASRFTEHPDFDPRWRTPAVGRQARRSG